MHINVSEEHTASIFTVCDQGWDSIFLRNIDICKSKQRHYLQKKKQWQFYRPEKHKVIFSNSYFCQIRMSKKDAQVKQPKLHS
jgi:hypothetical protein